VQNGVATATGNIFIDISKNVNYAIYPHSNGLSDHNAQIIKFKNLNTEGKHNATQIRRNFNKHSITNFKIKLSFETWDDIIRGNDVSIIFNNFHSTYLRIFYSSFIKRKRKGQNKGNE
jgi:hypothetical protein